MNRPSGSDFVTEPSRQVPVLRDVDVAIAGSGLCSTFAAIAAGRCGAKTLVIERYGSLGGNIGPGMILGGGLHNEAEGTLPGGLAGISKEFMARLDAMRSRGTGCYPEESSLCAYLAREMMTEAGVEVLLSACVSEPIMGATAVRGLFVETISGRVAVTAKVTIDGTGTASVARRAGAPLTSYLAYSEADKNYIRSRYLDPEFPTLWNDNMVHILMSGVDLETFRAHWDRPGDAPEEDRKWGEKSGEAEGYPGWLLPALHKAWEDDTFRTWCDLEPGVQSSAGRKFRDMGNGVVAGTVSAVGAIDAGDAEQVSRIEDKMRRRAFQLAHFYIKNVPGFEKASPLFSQPYFHWRGGPHIEGDHTLTPKECFEGAKFDDALYRNIHEHLHGGEASGFDVPLSITLPQGIDGLLVCGRGAAYQRRGHDPTGMRARPSMMVFGQGVGTAAAVAALDAVAPRDVDMRKVQGRLVQDGIVLGDASRLAELGLA